MQIDNLNISLSDKNQQQQPSSIDQQQSQDMHKRDNLAKYQKLIGELHANKGSHLLKELKYTAEIEYNGSYYESLEEIEKIKYLENMVILLYCF
jgi:hypothetical protein